MAQVTRLTLPWCNETLRNSISPPLRVSQAHALTLVRAYAAFGIVEAVEHAGRCEAAGHNSYRSSVVKVLDRLTANSGRQAD